MPLHDLSEDQLRGHCKRHFENLEKWLRDFVENQASEIHGADFVLVRKENGDFLVSKRISDKLRVRRETKPKQYPRLIDAADFGELVELICKPDLFNELFRPGLSGAFPDGREEARTFLLRLKEIRDPLYHANSISVRQAEQVICYSNDVIDSLKEFYVKMGKEKEFNVPEIVRLTDSFGALTPLKHTVLSGVRGAEPRRRLDPNCALRPGDKITIEVKVDPTFLKTSYQIKWVLLGETIGTSPKIVVEIKEVHIGEKLRFRCTVTSNNNWHRFGTYDDRVYVDYKVLSRR